MNNKQKNGLVTSGSSLINEMSEDEQVAWLRLIRDRSWSTVQKHQLLNALSGPQELYQTSFDVLKTLVTGRVKKAKTQGNQYAKGIERDIAWLNQTGNSLLCVNEGVYPELLKQITDPPIALFVRGNLDVLMEPKISIVGSRRPTPAGVVVCKKIAADLADLGIVVTSGMALGIDGIAHTSVLERDEATIAVMGCGLDIISPARHRHLFEKIASNGLLLSEYPIGYPASKYTFPQRNRIVSGLSYGVVIIEAAERSGTLITAKLAMEQDREVFVVPGSPLNPQYAGSHRLIQSGASLIGSVDDILHGLAIPLQSALEGSQKRLLSNQISLAVQAELKTDNPVLACIDYQSTATDKIILDSGLTAGEVSSMLLMLEIEGFIAATNQGGFVRIN